MRVLVTGGAGFIGSNPVHLLIDESDQEVVKLGNLTYAENLDSLPSVENHARNRFEQADITVAARREKLFQQHQPDAELYVTDHAKALPTVLQSGTPGQTYNIGGNNELQNIDLVRKLYRILDKEIPVSENHSLSDRQRETMTSYQELIVLVAHDLRYAISAAKIKWELDWQPFESAQTDFRKTVRCFLDNRDWWSRILSGDYQLERQGPG